MFIRCAVLLLSTLQFAAGTWAQSAVGAAAMPTAFADGEHWEWQVTITPDIGEARTTSRTAVATADGLRFKNQRGFVYPTAMPFETSQFFNTKSRTPWMQWPLEVGKSWTFEGEFNPNNRLAVVRQTAKVVGVEDVTVPAGTFSAYKVQYTGTAQSSSETWERNETIWYAPAAKAFVKATIDTPAHKGLRELTSYAPAPPSTAQK